MEVGFAIAESIGRGDFGLVAAGGRGGVGRRCDATAIEMRAVGMASESRHGKEVSRMQIVADRRSEEANANSQIWVVTLWFC